MVASPPLKLPKEPLVAKRLVLLAVVAKKLVLVLLVVVLLIPVKFWRVEDPYERRLAAVTDPKVELPALRTVAKRLVEEAVVLKKLVEVPLVVVLLIPVKF